MNQICVRFTVSEEKQIQGTIVKVLADSGYYHMNKIVLIVGYKPKKHDSWSGELPRDGELWICNPIEESQHDDPTHGAIFVKLVKKGDAIPAQFTGIEVIFNADALCGHYWNGNLTGYYPVFGDHSDGRYCPDEIVTATPEQETTIRETLKAIRDYHGSIGDNDPAIPMVFNGMTPEQAYAVLAEESEQESRKWDAEWLEKQHARVGKFIYASGGYAVGRIAVLVGAKVDERHNHLQMVSNIEDGREYESANCDTHNRFLTEEVVEWFKEVARIALAQPVPSESIGNFYGAPSNVPFPVMPEIHHFPTLGPDKIEAVKVLYGLTPQVLIKTKYMGVIIGGEDGD